MHNQAGGFIAQDEIAIFMDDATFCQFVFSRGELTQWFLRRRGSAYVDVDQVMLLQSVILFFSLTVNPDMSLADQAEDGGQGNFLVFFTEESVQADIAEVRGDGELHSWASSC
jgi:hypothetical protein